MNTNAFAPASSSSCFAHLRNDDNVVRFVTLARVAFADHIRGVGVESAVADMVIALAVEITADTAIALDVRGRAFDIACALEQYATAD